MVMKKNIILGLAITLILSCTLSISQAAYNPISRNVCALSVHPFKPDAAGSDILGPTDSYWYNIFLQGSPECDNHVIYPNAYTPQPPDPAQAPLKNVSGIENKSGPATYHIHKYFNDSVQDDKYYKSFTDSFQIILESDALANTDLSQLVCYSPGEGGTVRETPGCNGNLTDWGGTEITFSPSTGVINWKFATSGSGRPRLYGINPGLNGKTGVPDTNDEQNRKLEFGVKLVSKNNNADIWSATTTSRILVRDQGISTWAADPVADPGSIAACAGDGTNNSSYDYSLWCTLPSSLIGSSTTIEQKDVTGYSVNGKNYSTGGKFYYWKEIGPVATIWQKKAPPPPSDLGCADLQWDGAFQKENLLGLYTPDNVNPNALLDGESAIMKFKTIYEQGSGNQRPLEYHWVSFFGDQNRPAWFTNEDSLYVYGMSQAAYGYLSSSLPARMLTVAHAAAKAKSAASNVSASNVNVQESTAAIQAATTNIGNFKDEITATLSGNPLTDDDNQIFYSGGSEGVTVGVQAFYADGKNVAGAGPMVNTTDGLKQKAQKCHLELVIQPPPVTCVSLDISPNTLQPNTPVTFTVTPHFSPGNKTIPLNYLWSADPFKLIIPGLGTTENGLNLGELQKIPGAVDNNGNGTWMGTGLVNIASTANGVNSFINNCPGGICQPQETQAALPSPGPIEVNPVNQLTGSMGAANSAAGNVSSTLAAPVNAALTQNMGGTDVFADFGEAAVLNPAISANHATSNAQVSPAATTIHQQSSVPNVQNQGMVNGAESSTGAFLNAMKDGGFKDSSASPGMAVNPYLETTDNQTYYTGSTGDTRVSVQAQGKDGTIYPSCNNSLYIPAPPPICKLLKVQFWNGNTEVAKEKMVAGVTYTIAVDQANSIKTDNTPIKKYSIVVYNTAGPGTLTSSPGNAASCAPIADIPVLNPGPVVAAVGTQFSTSVNCKYIYTPKALDQITLKADPTDNVAACTITQTIPKPPTTPICKSLNLITAPALTDDTIDQGQLVAFATDPRDTNDQPRQPIVYTETGNGYFVANPNNPPVPDCPAVPASGTFEAISSCHYSYQAPSDNTAATVNIKVKQDDGIAACSRTFNVPATPHKPEMCLALNLRVNGQYTLNPLIEAGQSYALQVEPMTDQGNLISMVEWTVSGSGKLIGDPSNPGICPTSIDNGSVVTMSVCRYIFASPPGSTNVGFRVRAVPDDGVANCVGQAQAYTPPQNETPYCLYLDLDYTPEPFNPLTDSQMNATVVMSDGSKYNDNVRFTSTNGAGAFSGGYSPTTGSGSSDFRTRTDNTNNTEQVFYNNGNSDSGVNIFLSDTNVRMSAACQRQLLPQPQQKHECTLPPHIARQDSTNQYCAEGGDSSSYCWSITGEGNPLFNNNSSHATGNCVMLNNDYSNFNLRVEDCNPDFRDFCFDTYQKENTPKIEKSISKDSNPPHYTTQINYSTSGTRQPETVDYKLDYTPANYQSGNSMTVKIYDPAFTGTITGVKTSADGSSTSPGGTIKFDLPNAISIDGYPYCGSLNAPSQMDKCFTVNQSEGYLQIQGIDSDNLISIEYKGILTPGLVLSDCQQGLFCNEQFKNKSKVTDVQFCHEETDSQGNTTVVCQPANFSDIESNTTLAELVCQYFLTRASGDVYLEDQLTYGIDVSKCYPFKNVSSTIVKPIPPVQGSLVKSGASGTVVPINHEICSAGQTDFASLNLTPAQISSLKELFGSEITTLSSQICEVGLVPGSDWNKENIAAAMAQNIGKLIRWDNGQMKAPLISSYQDIVNAGRVYYYKGSGTGSTLTINQLDIPEGSGALTIIVENADLQINGNISYTAGLPADTVDKISSLGVIVLDGNMYVAPGVEELDGAYFVQRTDSKNLMYGNILSGSKSHLVPSGKMLTIKGSVYGNIGPLFMNRQAAGDIAKDQGAITIRYDQRIIQNPPAGMAELLGTFSQSQIAQ